jgi:hypothetical protein
LTFTFLTDIFNFRVKNTRLVCFIFATIFFELLSFFYPTLSYAANLTVAKNTLQSSRMSFNGRVKSPTIAGSSHVWIYTSANGSATSITTAGLKPGDTLTIGENTGYIIDTIVDDDEFTLTTNLSSGDADDTDVIYFKAKPQHVITFKTASAISGGFFQVLIPAAASGSNNGIPDITGWDFNSSVSVSATDVSGYTFGSVVATAAGETGCNTPANFHCFEFHYTGSGGAGTDITLNIGNTDGSNTMVAPAPSAGRAAYTADMYTFIIKNFTNGSNPNSATATDEVTGKFAVIESIRVTATVDPSITFKIEGVAKSASTCSLTTDVDTTSTAVPFGVLTLDTFRVGSQKLTVSTNAVSGYAVTAIENTALSNLAVSPSYIADTTCDAADCTHTSGSDWATNTVSGFGYTTAVVASSPTIAPIAPHFQHFPNIAATESPFQIMSSPGIASSQAIYVCYQIAVGATQPAGTYENQVTYTATASF